MFRLRWPLFLLLLVYGASPALAEQRSLSVEEAIRLAHANNPEVRIFAANVDAARARLAGGSLLFQTNPSLTVTAGPRSSPEGRSQDDSLQVLQQFEIGGQRRARIDAATAALESTEAQAQALRAEVTARVREGFGRAQAAEQRSRLATEAFAVAEQGVGAAEERFRAGAAALLEVNTARIELGRAARGRGEAARRRAEGFAELHLLLGLDPLEELTLRGDLRAPEPVAGPAELVQEALERRGEVRAGRRGLDAARAEARLASREAIPSPRIGASFAREEGSDTTIIQGVVALDLPIFNRNQAARGIAAARVRQLETALEATDRRIRQEVLTALARVQAARASADGYAGDVVKAMQENMDLVTESYRAGKIDFLQLLVIRRQTLEARREHIDVLEELNAARAQLDRALGRVD
ncbi:MAG: TolC family protein [Thermoanaerobaculia bacterium]